MNLQVHPIEHIPEIHPSVDLGAALLEGLARSALEVQSKDIIAVAQKIVSKAEGRVVQLAAVHPSAYSQWIARHVAKDPRLVEVILSETRRLVRLRRDVLICETHHGFVCANAGVDRSNVDGGNSVTLLPADPDQSAAALARQLGCGVIITDTFGRPWREGLVDVAIGSAGVPPLLDYRGRTDGYGYPLRATVLAPVDALAAAAGLVMGKTSRVPAVRIRGFEWTPVATNIRLLKRSSQKDLFR